MRSIVLLAVAVVTLSATFLSGRDAAASSTYYVRSYRVEVEWSLWKSGYSQWRTEFESSDYQEARLVYDLLVSARDNDELFDVLCDELESWVPVDVRMRTVYRSTTKLYRSSDLGLNQDLLRRLEIR